MPNACAAADWRLLLAIAVVASTATSAAQDTKRTVWDGIYTEAQARRGQPIYQRTCSYCHRDDLRGFGGDSAAAALTGARFFVRWRGETVGEMFNIVSETMPKEAADVLSPQEYIDVISYIFSVNAMPIGARELPADPAQLAQVAITDKPAR